MEECFNRSRRQLTQWFTQSSEKIYRTLCTEKNYKRRERSGRATAVCYRTVPKVNAAFSKKGIVNARNIYSYVMNPASNPI